MAYVPMTGFAGVVAGTDARWQSLITNHGEVQDTLTPPIVDMPRIITSTSTTYQTRLRFYVRRNLAGHTVRFVVRAVANSGAGTIRANVGASNNTAAVSGAVTNYTIDVTGDDDAECTLEMKVASGGDSITMYAVQAYLVTDGTETEWVGVGSRWYTASENSVPVRVVQDLMQGPPLLLQDRMVPLCYHVSDCEQAISGKTFEVWGMENTTQQTPIGRLWIPQHDSAVRTCRIDAYTTASGSATFRLRVGSQLISWTTTGWHSATMEIGPGPIDVWAWVTPTATTNASIRTVQIWRGDY
jgi:hypothetical protein